MVFPLWFIPRLLETGRLVLAVLVLASLVLGSIEQCGGRWQAAARDGRLAG
jgi:hypothetical protein